MVLREVKVGGVGLGCLLVAACLLMATLAPGQARAQTPSQAVVENVLKKQWAPVSTMTGGQKKSVTVHSIKLGNSAKASLSDTGVDGVPRGGTVTPVLVDFTVREYYSDSTQAVRRVREARVYKDAFGEWRMLGGSARAPDVRTTEPAVK